MESKNYPKISTKKGYSTAAKCPCQCIAEYYRQLFMGELLFSTWSVAKRRE